MTAIQLNFFKTEEECERDSLIKEVEKQKRSLEKVRRGTYSEINQLKNSFFELYADVEIIKRNICK